MAPDRPDWKEVAVATPVFRFVEAAIDPTWRAGWFIADGVAKPDEKLGRKEHRDVLLGMSVFRTEEDAQAEWDRCRGKAEESGQPMRIPDAIAEVVLVPGCGIEIADKDEVGGHMYAKGDPQAFVGLIKKVRRGDEPPDRIA
jgi:hypothetical protein